jgi:ubiquitin-associated SH3 domain-containing protein
VSEERTSLIVYAVPLGPLGDQLDDYWRRAAPVRPNAALDYPPHCTVTGFFHRRREDMAGVAAALEQALADGGGAPAAPVVDRMVLDGPWLGLVLGAPALVDLAARFARLAPTGPDDDAVRPKADPHLSLAYEFPPEDESALAALAATTVRPDASARWELRLYEGRRGGPWGSVAAWPLAPVG